MVVHLLSGESSAICSERSHVFGEVISKTVIKIMLAVPTVMPSPVMAVLAVACVILTTLGTDTGLAPPCFHIRRATARRRTIVRNS